MKSRGIAPGLLLAMPQLRDPNFDHAVVLMIEHTENGSFGLIVNRQTELSVTEVMSTLGVTWTGDPGACVWIGGPVMPRTGWLLHEPSQIEQSEGSVPVTPEIILSTSPEPLRALAASPPRNVRFLMGYSGWGSSQLERELAMSSWILAEASPQLVFETPAEEMWETAMRSLGIDPASLIPADGIH